MIILGLLIISSLAAVFIGNLHNVVGAIILGLDAAGIDYFLLWLRYKFTKPDKLKYLVLIIFGGLAVRALFLFAFLKFGLWWFGTNQTEFYVFVAAILTIPIWNFVAAYRFRTERDQG